MTATSSAVRPRAPRRIGALDGLRGVAVTAVVVYHIVPAAIPGGWLGVDIFLVLSGYLIASLLLRERRTWGRINYGGFLRRRARRLLPTQVVATLTVLLVGAFVLPPGQAAKTGGDALASLLQYANWRFLLGHESYFAAVSLPSMFRHTWSLSVQEQFYVVLPIVLGLLLTWVRSRLWRVLVVCALAGTSMWWMAQLYVPGTDPSRVYYGTDTRAFELLIGVAFALAIERTRPARLERLVGWRGGAVPALGAVVIAAAMFVVSEYSAFLFPWGLAVVALLTLLVIAAASAATPNPVNRALSWAPLQAWGRLSYPLYVWHWPVIVLLKVALFSRPAIVQQLLAVAVTVPLAWVTHRLLEDPIHRGGLRGWWPGRPAFGRVAGAIAVVTVGAVVWGLPTYGPALALAWEKNSYTLPVARSAPLPQPATVVLLGNSTAYGLMERLDPASAPDLSVSAIASFGCSPFVRELADIGPAIQEAQNCRPWLADWRRQVAQKDPDIVLLFPSRTFYATFREGGRKVAFGTPEHDAVLVGILEEIREGSQSGGARPLGIVGMSCHRKDFTLGVTDDVEASMARHLNGVMRRWAQGSGASFIDAYAVLCPADRPTEWVGGEPLYEDDIHFSRGAAPQVWRWMVPQVRQIIAGSR